ncbi:MAG TPA: extracellular solute-binding protein [Solirubrobacteraceae bacterium]|jgi:iron(III) transport system substrate-binding protein
MRKHHLGLLAAGLVFAGIPLSGCGNSSSDSGQSLVLYNGQHVQTTDTLVTAFEKATGITVNVRSNDEDTLADQIVTEADNSPADVIYTENSPALEYLQNKNLLSPVDSATLAVTPSKFDSPQGKWLAVSTRVSVLIYNPSLISASQLPKSVLQLANPEYKGKLAIAAGETDFQPIVTSVARTDGRAATLKWLEAIKANASGHIYPDNETIASEVNRGAAAFGVINQYYWYRMKAELGSGSIHSKLAYFAPRDPGYVIDVSGAAILKSSKNQSAAQKFLAFLVSHQGQEIIAHSLSFEYPVVPTITTAAPETPFGKLQPNSITIPQLGDGSTAIGLLREAGLL